MAVLGRLLISSAERMDLPDMLSIDSYAAGDWKYFLKGLVGDSKPFILKGFDVIDPQNAIGTTSCSIRVAESMVFYPGSNAGSFYHGLEEGHPQAEPLVPELRTNATNFVYLTFSTFNTAVDTRAFWDPDKDGGAGGEFTQDVNTESVLKVEVNVSTGSFPANTIPIAKIKVSQSGAIESITDCRDLLFRLGTGGINPDPFQSFQFRSLPDSSYQRTEPPITMLAGGDNPFQGGDKNIYTLKEWMDLVMAKFKELSGTTYWYEDLSSFSLISGFIDALATTFKSKGQWQHSSATPGLVTWTEDIQVKVTQDPRDTIIRAGNKTLADEEVAYIHLQRNKLLNASDEAVSWTSGQPYINTVGGAVGYFANLAQGDWVKKVNDPNHLYLRVEQFYDSVSLGGATTTAASARSVRLSANYQGSTVVERGRYDKGVYLASDVVVSARNASALTTAGGNFHWLVTRSDVIENISSIDTFELSGTLDQTDGKSARVSVTAHGLLDGDRITVTAPAAQAGTYVIEVEDVNTFYIETTNTTDGAFTGFYGLATTSTRDNGYGLQLESANHGFDSSDTVIIAGTTNYNGAYLINKRSATQIQFPFGANNAAETTGTATLARVNVRSEQGLVKIVQGESIEIGDGAAENMKQFLGMGSLAETHPIYNVSSNYSALNGMQNYNALETDNVTARLSKLTAMMADKAQDKTVRYLANTSLINITNTTNGLAQEITFDSGATLTLVTPGSTGNATITLPFVAPGISLLQNQSAYITIDRNNTSTPSISVINTVDLVVDENTFVIASRLTTAAIYLWTGSLITTGTSPFAWETIVRQNQTIKLVNGGTWSWNLATSTLTWSANAHFAVPGLALTDNQILAGSAVLADGDIAYVYINRYAPGGNLTVNVAPAASVVLTNDLFVIARRTGSSVLVGQNFQLKDGEFLELDGALAEINRRLNQLRITEHESAIDKVRVGPANITQLDGTILIQELGGFTLDFDGATINFTSGVVLESDDATPLGVNFTPFSVPVGEYFWYGVSLIPGVVGVDNKITAQIQVTPASAANASAALAPYPDMVGDKKLGAVQVYNNAGSIEVYAIDRLGVGSGSGGSGLGVLANLYDPINTTLPTGTSAVIDGVTISNGDIVLFSNLAVNNNRVYKVSGVGVSLSWMALYVFSDGVNPTVGETVTIKSGTSFGLQVGMFNGTTYTFNDYVRHFSGTDYFEQGSLKTTNIANNTTAEIFSVTAAGSENMNIDFSIKRGLNKQNGTAYIQYIAGQAPTIALAEGYIADTGMILSVASSTENAVFYSNLTSTGDNSGLDTAIRDFVELSDGSTVVGGDFTDLNGTTRNRLIKLDASGNLDTTFSTNLGTGFNAFVRCLEVQTDDKILVGGTFTSLNGITRNYLVRLNSDGTVDTTFYTNLGTGFNGNVESIKVQPDGDILVGGSFSSLNGVGRNALVRLNSDGTEDTAFYTNLGTGFVGDVLEIQLMSDNKIVIGGSFTSLNGTTRNRLVRLNTDGTLDTAFSTNIGTAFNNTVNTIVIQSNDKILLGGVFTSFNGVTRNRLLRLESDGTVDTAFYTNLGTGVDNSSVSTIAVQASGDILVGGSFTGFNGNTRNRIFKISSTGIEDTAFYTSMGTAFDAFLTKIFINTSGEILVGGNFITFNGNTRNFIATLTDPTIILSYTSDNSGDTGTMKYSVKRWSDSLGGPGGIPSYSSSISTTAAAGAIYNIQYHGGDGNLAGSATFQVDVADSSLDLNGLKLGTLLGPTTLNDNQVAAAPAILISDTYKVAFIDYSIERNGEMEAGTIMLTHNTVTPSIVNTNTFTAALGITLSADLSGGNVRILYISTSTGFSASMKYSIKKWS